MELIKSGTIQLFGAVSSLQGGRAEQQDDYRFADTPLGFLCVVCDGMGGGPGGKTASYIVKTELVNTLLDCSPLTPRDQALRMAAARANQALEEKMKQMPQLVGMGSTFVAVLINQHSAFVAHAGDSRFYQLHGKKCLYRTADHSLVGELVKRKALTEEQARVSPQSNVITRSMGSTTNHLPDIQERPYRKGDRFVLCSDGVWGIMPHEELLTRLTAPSDISSLVHTLSTEIDQLGEAQGGHHDNHTLAVIEINADSTLRTHRFKWPLLTGIGLGIILFTGIGLSAPRLISILNQQKNQGSEGLFHEPYASPEAKHADRATPSTVQVPSPTAPPSTENASIKESTSPQPPADSTATTQQKTDTAKETSPDKENSHSPRTTKELTQRIIDILNKASTLKDKNLDTIDSRMGSLREEACSLLDSLKACYSNKDSEGFRQLSKMDELKDRKLWYYDEPDKHGFYHTTDTCAKRLQSLSKRMTWFKEKYVQ